MLSVNFTIGLKMLVLIFKALHGLAPRYLSDMPVSYEPAGPLTSSGTGRLVIPCPHKKVEKLLL